jgi:hypothetical protein
VIRLDISGNPFSADETVLGLVHQALKEILRTGSQSCTALVKLKRAGVTVRMRISIVESYEGYAPAQAAPDGVKQLKE